MRVIYLILFEEMKFSSLLQKNKYKDTTILPACDVIKMATINGALAQGREKESGKIQIGYDATIAKKDEILQIIEKWRKV